MHRSKVWRVLKGDTASLTREEAGILLRAFSKGVRGLGVFLFLAAIAGYYTVGNRPVMFAIALSGGVLIHFGHSILRTVRS